MSMALEERCYREVLDHNVAIKALKSEVEILGTEMSLLKAEVDGFSSVRAEAASLRQEGEGLRKQLEGAKAAEELVVKKATRANEIAEGLRKELEAECQSSEGLQQQIILLMQWLDSAG